MGVVTSYVCGVLFRGYRVQSDHMVTYSTDAILSTMHGQLNAYINMVASILVLDYGISLLIIYRHKTPRFRRRQWHLLKQVAQKEKKSLLVAQPTT
jgi:hypothetical protein